MASALQGEGARLHGGRWNHPGTAMVYTSVEQSLCVLELLVHVDPHTAPEDLVLCGYDVPGAEVAVLDPGLVPAAWRGVPAPPSVADVGTEWVRSGASLALDVPSALTPAGRNVLLNPAHRALGRVVLVERLPFAFDPRLR